MHSYRMWHNRPSRQGDAKVSVWGGGTARPSRIALSYSEICPLMIHAFLQRTQPLDVHARRPYDDTRGLDVAVKN